MPEDIPAALHQTIGSLNAKADQASRDISDLKSEASKNIAELRNGQGALTAQIAGLPDTIRQIVEEVAGNRLVKVEERLASVEMTVNRWKGVLALLAFAAAGLGWLLSHLDVRKVFGGGT